MAWAASAVTVSDTASNDAVRTISGPPITATVRIPIARGRGLARFARAIRSAIYTYAGAAVT